jgi:hypothetical protein
MLYAVFFIVQFCSITASDHTISVITVGQKQAGKEKIFKGKSDPCRKNNIRLNKRFQPAIADGLVNSGEDVPVKYILTNNQVKPKDYLLISFIVATSLRGPPIYS